MSERTAIERDNAILTMGEGITDIAMRTLKEDRDLDPSEIAAVEFLARNALEWCRVGELDRHLSRKGNR